MTARLVALVFICGITSAYILDRPDEINPYNPNAVSHVKRLHKQAGKNTRLRCSLPELSTNIQIQWRFQKCGEYPEKTCETNFHDISIMEDTRKIGKVWISKECEQSCRTLNMINITENDSGLYQCYFQQKTSSENISYDLHIIKTYELVVADTPADNFPEILEDFPKNVTANLFEKVSLQCKVHSNQVPTILWLKHRNENEISSTYGVNNPYEALKSDGDIPLSRNIYLSKLIIYKPTLKDIGIYECVAVNNIGFSHKTIYLDVIDTSQFAVKLGSPFYSLFLIPISFLFLPLSFWICYSYKRFANGKRETQGHNGQNKNGNEQSAKNLVISLNIKSQNEEPKNYQPLIVL